jgi:aryl carrier-like protein
LYVTKGTNVVHSYNFDTKSFGSLLSAHGSAGALDISPDGSKLAVADRQVDQGLSSITINGIAGPWRAPGYTVSVASVPNEVGISAVAFAGNGAIVTTSYPHSTNGEIEYLPFRKFDCCKTSGVALVLCHQLTIA